MLGLDYHVFSPSPINIYETVEKFRESILPTITSSSFTERKNRAKFKLEEVINLHDPEGLRDMSQIEKMVDTIQSGEHITETDGMPNIKLAKSAGREWVLFDGHHSFLAYMATGFTYLEELPHLRVVKGRGDPITEEEIHVFFGEHAHKLKRNSWRDYNINW